MPAGFVIRPEHKTTSNNNLHLIPLSPRAWPPSLLAQIISRKYQYGLPLYRQEALFKQYGIELTRKTMSDWMLKSAAACSPI
jgi:transposase